MVYSRLKQLYFDDPKTNDKKKSRTDGSNDAQNQAQADCLPCRVVSGGGLTMLGAYVIKHFYDDLRIDKSKVKFSFKNNKSNNIYGFILGAFLLSLGVARLSNFQFHD